MNLKLDPSNGTPLYRQLADEIRRHVAVGALREGDRVPTVRELAVLARVNRNTAARAVQLLEAAGIVHSRVGQGTFVAAAAEGTVGRGLDAEIDRELDALIERAAAAGFDVGDLPDRLRRRIDEHRRESEEDSR